MGSAHRAGCREALEAALPVEALATLRAICAALGIPAARWPSVPTLRCFASLAFHCTVSALVEHGGATLEHARAEAGSRLRLDPETMRKRGERAAIAAFTHGGQNVPTALP